MFYLSSSLISLLLYVQQSMSFPTQLPCRLVLQEKSVDLIEAAPGARNDEMFLNTTEEPNMGFCMF